MNPIKKSNAFTSYLETIITSIVISVIVFVTVVNQPKQGDGVTIDAEKDNVTITNFNFHVHCPLRNRSDGGFVQLMKHLQISNLTTVAAIEAQLSAIETYAVFERVFSLKGELLMSYCGWARLPNETDCSNAVFVCTIPGPMFRIAVGQEIQIIWVNQIDGPDLNWNFSGGENCYDTNNTNPNCWQPARYPADSSCTLLSPTQLGESQKKVRISPQSAPISPHVHGIETRPTFDGGPLNWFNNAGDKGPGYFSLSNNDYYTFFERPLTFWPGLLNATQRTMVKVSRHLNKQPAGFFFYHDHAMRATVFNNMKGSAGFYVLYNTSAESTLPKEGEEAIFIFHYHNQGDVRDYSSLNASGTNNEIYVTPVGDTSYVSKKGLLYRNMTYRFRFINGHFDSYYNNISFAAFYKTVKNVGGYDSLQEVEPPKYSSNFSQYMNTLPFTAIGADGALFHSPIHNLKKFNLAGGERLDLLIKFNSVPASVTKVYVICYDGADKEKRYVVKLIYSLNSSVVANRYADPNQFSSLPVPFYNLSQIAKADIAVRRMRPLFSRPAKIHFSINMHPFFQKAASQEPKIGSTEDWFIINTISQSHPMHFHIINFQVQEDLILKTTQTGCTLYELDYFRQTGIPLFQVDDHDQLCNLLDSLTPGDMEPLWPIFNSYLLQNETFSSSLGVTSGKEVMAPLGNANTYSVTGCSLNNLYKYICSNSSSNIYPWYRRWKDTVEIKPYTVSRLRVRWAKTVYDPAESAFPFFNYNQDQMVEFPGSTYHCHILPHEQNMMVRPIMFQHSDAYIASYTPSQVANTCSGTNWRQKYQCINNILHCPLLDNNQSKHKIFQFHLYCPVISTTNPTFIQLVQHLNVTNNSTQYVTLASAISKVQTYIIFIKAFRTSIDNNNILLSFCGWVREQKDKDCSAAYYTCSIPGPMFYLPTNLQFDVIWVNKINGTGLNWSDPEHPSCYSEFANSSYCRILAKAENEECGFYQETNLSFTSKKTITISPEKASINIHMHGLQNRPAFDGHPSSWFNNAGDKGLGYESLSNPDYFSFFNNSINYTNVKLSPDFQSNIKINRYSTGKHPGMFFYHDHSFQLTSYNNQKGLAGLFIVYDLEVQKNYPLGVNEYYIIFNFANEGDLRQQAQNYSSSSPEVEFSPVHQNIYSNINATLYRHVTYRFRFLNSHFDFYYDNISFAYFSSSRQQGNITIIQEEDPPLQEADYSAFSAKMTAVSFTVIGADSTMLSQPIHNISVFALFAAERLDLLISFKDVPANVSNIYVVCYDASDTINYYVVKIKISLNNAVVNNPFMEPSEFGKTSVSFYDLKQINESDIVVKRMRPLFILPTEKLFTINMRPHFHEGQAEDPKIGTTEDWYFINTVSEPHPIHIHLINFQITQVYSLRVVPEGCTVYELDFLRETNISIFQDYNDSSLCNYLLNITLEELFPFYPNFSSYLPETERKLADIGMVSGKNVLQKWANSSLVEYQNCTLGNIYKYICQNKTSGITPWYRRWKDTAGVRGWQVSVFRIRWASSQYIPEKQAYPYFSYGEDELTEYPGFVYHCHILPHEDNMMMRPIALQPSDRYLSLAAKNSDANKCMRNSSLENYFCINKKLGCVGLIQN